ncbi:MAG TPA: cytochrome c3 family protein, partial [Steroidobacteraceae bacterium]|nr:cytochrome c3 family protein [Steroidobacteraceae bacterium]
MAQVFHPRQLLLLKGVALGALLAAVAAAFLYRVATQAPVARNVPVEQPIPFSHKHHVGDDGLDCRYCHSSVETSAFAGIPSVATCRTCHSQLFTDAPVLAPLFDTTSRRAPVYWTRIHQLPDFVYFNHSIHVAKGVGCSTCHGRVDQMPLTWRVASLEMQWCLGCHRAPERYVRPRERVFDMSWQPPANQLELGR